MGPTAHAFDPVWVVLSWESFGKLSVLGWISWIIKFPLHTAVTVALAALSYPWFESPVLAQQDRWFKYDSGRAVRYPHD